MMRNISRKVECRAPPVVVGLLQTETHILREELGVTHVGQTECDFSGANKAAGVANLTLHNVPVVTWL